MAYARQNIHRLQAYVPGEQPTDSRLLKLNTNENPYPPCQAVLDAVAAVGGELLRRYPPPAAARFRQLAAQVHGVEPNNIIATNGGDELLRLAIGVFCEPNGASNGLAITQPTYSLYETLAAIHQTPLTTLALNDDFSLPTDLAQRVIDAGCKLLMLVNPQAPSGRGDDPRLLAKIASQLRGHAVLLIDEAYVNFAKQDAVTLLDPSRGLDNVLILRSLSKGYSLAGLRFGYGIGHAGVIAAMDKARDSYNTDILAQTAACAALENRDEATKTWAAVIAERIKLSETLTRHRWQVLPSQTNFLLVTPPDEGANAADIYQLLKQRAVYVRYFDQPRLYDKLRITIGSPQQNQRLLDELTHLGLLPPEA